MDDRSNDLRPSLKLFNVIFLGFSFLLMFTGFQTCGMISQTVLKSYINQTTINGTVHFHGNGYTSLAIIYIVFACANWLAPSVVSVVGPKYSMVIGGITYTLYLATFIHPLTWTLYTASVIIGIGAAIIWTGQGNFLTLNSDDMTMGRNSGIFWAMLQCSLLIGNIYVYFAWRGVDVIADKQRVPLFIGLTAICGLGTLSLLLLKSNPVASSVSSEADNSLLSAEETQQSSNEVNQSSDQKFNDSEADESHVEISEQRDKSKSAEALDALLTAIRLFKTKEMLLLSVTFFYTGLELTFFSGVYSTSVAATSEFGSDADRLVGLTGIFVGVGEILGGGIFGIFGKKTVKHGRDPIILLGGICHLVAFMLIFLNIPDDAPISKGEAHVGTYITPSTALAIACAFLLGFADACFNTQCYSIIGGTYPNNSAAAFALFKFEQSLAAAIGFFYSSYVVLKYQLLILVIFCFCGMLSFFYVEHKVRKRPVESSSEYSNIGS